jgi:hypothetical protein
LCGDKSQWVEIRFDSIQAILLQMFKAAQSMRARFRFAPGALRQCTSFGLFQLFALSARCHNFADTFAQLRFHLLRQMRAHNIKFIVAIQTKRYPRSPGRLMLSGHGNLRVIEHQEHKRIPPELHLLMRVSRKPREQWVKFSWNSTLALSAACPRAMPAVV